MTKNRKMMEDIALMFKGNKDCDFKTTSDAKLLLLIKESIEALQNTEMIEFQSVLAVLRKKRRQLIRKRGNLFEDSPTYIRLGEALNDADHKINILECAKDIIREKGKE